MTTPMSDDTHRMMVYDANKKSMLVAYLLWLLLGLCGAHRFYMGKWFTGLLMLGMSLFSFVMMFILVGYFTIVVPALWALVDLLLIPGWVNRHNSRLISGLDT
ncbi:MAG: TM2 domain-containing protein [Gemmatimonadota bacterium]|nr:TM2 domain-containing protein [Gemmatimonadota bacterium]